MVLSISRQGLLSWVTMRIVVAKVACKKKQFSSIEPIYDTLVPPCARQPAPCGLVTSKRFLFSPSSAIFSDQRRRLAVAARKSLLSVYWPVRLNTYAFFPLLTTTLRAFFAAPRFKQAPKSLRVTARTYTPTPQVSHTSHYVMFLLATPSQFPVTDCTLSGIFSAD